MVFVVNPETRIGMIAHGNQLQQRKYDCVLKVSRASIMQDIPIGKRDPFINLISPISFLYLTNTYAILLIILNVIHTN